MHVVNPPLPPGVPNQMGTSHHLPTSVFLLVAASTAVAATADTLNCLVLLELRLRHSADTCRVEVRFFRLDTAQTTQLDKSVSPRPKQKCSQGQTNLLIALLLPLGNQVGISILVLEQEII